MIFNNLRHLLVNRAKTFGVLCVVVFATVSFFAAHAHAGPAPTIGDAKVVITDPNSTPVAGAAVSVWCSNGAFISLGTTDDSGTVEALPSPDSNCVGSTTIAFQISKPGFLTRETATGDSFVRSYEQTIDPENPGTFDGSINNTYAIMLHPLEVGNTDSYLAQYWTTNVNGIPEFPDGAPDFSTTTQNISYHLLDNAAPNPAVGSLYAVRFSKTVHFVAGNYTFTICSDDGERLYVDGAMIANNWVSRGRTCDTPTADITAGDHTITLEYYQQGGPQSLDFSYTLTTIPGNLIDGYESADTAVTPTAPGTENGDYTKTAAADESYWTTAMSTNDNGYDSQVFNFKPDLTGATNPQLNVSWTGHGAVPDAKKVYLSVWNFMTSSWDALVSGHCAVDCTLTGATNALAHKDGSGNVWLWAKADNSYVPAIISDLTDNLGLLPVQWTTDQNATSELAWDNVSHTNFADYALHVSDSDLLNSHSITPTVSDSNSQGWYAVASSTDGSKLVGVVDYGDIWTSNDSGLTWVDQTGAGSHYWISVASSADGTMIIAADNNGDIWSGAFNGTTWIWTDLSTVSTNYPGAHSWTGVALSADNSNGGFKLAATAWDGAVFTAIDVSGTWTWTSQTSAANTVSQGVAMSADGAKVVVGGWSGDIKIGTFDGTSWTWADQAGTNLYWSSFAMTPDGTKIIAGPNQWGHPWIGTYDGTNWTWTEETGANTWGYWNGVTISSDGTKVAAGSDCGDLIKSSNGGTDWVVSNALAHCWRGLASSADGHQIIGAANGADVYISSDTGATWTSATGTRWYYRVKSVNANGQATISDEHSFTFASTNSCPFVFTWDGAKFRFVIDASNSGNLSVGLDRLLWDANPWYKDPNANNGYPNPLSYTKIPHGGLVPKTDHSETYYDIRTSTELDETNYYDKAALEVIDHDPSVDVYPDYRNNGQFHSIAVNAPAPVSVIDQDGQDVKSLVSADDNTYWHSRLARSISDPTYLTIKLADGDTTPADLKLLVKGTKEGPFGGKGSDKLQYENSSGQFVNVPTDKDIFVVTRAGSPHASRNFQNTYGVQYKVIDLSGLDIKDNTIRLVTTSTARQWDIDWLAVDTNPDNLGTVTEETPYSADLHERGISNMVLDNPSDPKMAVQDAMYDQLVKHVGEGFPLTGNATKYGDVTPLLSAVDNKFVIMTQGDELALKYAVPTQADGTIRDFIYYTWDYHKPQHYALGHTIAPLPFNEMTEYPYHPDQEHYPTDADHNAYQNTYNTRVINWGTQQQNGNQIHHSLNTDAIGISISNGSPLQSSYMSGGTATAASRALVQNLVPGSKPVGTPASPAPVNSSPVFSRTLKQGDSGDDITALQAYLFKAGFPVGKPGKPGSDGHYTKTFGPGTKSALKKFQKAHGITATGNLGPMTQVYMNSH